MKKLLTSTALLFYLLVLLVFFFAGTYFSAIAGVAKGQGLAGPAIVLGYGVIAAALALLASFFLVAYLGFPQKLKLCSSANLTRLVINRVTPIQVLEVSLSFALT